MKKKTNSRSDELRQMLGVAAFKVDPAGSLRVLAAKAGLTEYAIYAAIKRGRITPGMACALEIAVGRDVLTKEQLCPEKYA